MSWKSEKKKQFIRWYYGHFENDPKSDVIHFGLVRSAGAQRLSRVLNKLGLTKYLKP